MSADSYIHIHDFVLGKKQELWIVHYIRLEGGPDRSQLTKQNQNRGSLDIKMEKQLINFLLDNRNAFALSPKDMPEIDPDFFCHQLFIAPGMRPVCHKKRQLREEKRIPAKKGTIKLLNARFLKEVQYPSWLANVVMRMCTDLNMACPKDPYPLLITDRLVNSTFRYDLLSFMDAYSRYNQIKMHPNDEVKTTFIIDDGNFYYKVMPFGLKNQVPPTRG
ncbi:hypothetical protein CR513_20773, partial [Mucuna pruriens]